MRYRHVTIWLSTDESAGGILVSTWATGTHIYVHIYTCVRPSAEPIVSVMAGKYTWPL